MHVYEVRPRRDHRGFDLISDVLPFGRLVVMTFGTHWNYYRQRSTVELLMPPSPHPVFFLRQHANFLILLPFSETKTEGT
jgi:hypothetical protein